MTRIGVALASGLMSRFLTGRYHVACHQLPSRDAACAGRQRGSDPPIGCRMRWELKQHNIASKCAGGPFEGADRLGRNPQSATESATPCGRRCRPRRPSADPAGGVLGDVDAWSPTDPARIEKPSAAATASQPKRVRTTPPPRQRSPATPSGFRRAVALSSCCNAPEARWAIPRRSSSGATRPRSLRSDRARQDNAGRTDESPGPDTFQPGRQLLV